MVNMKFTVECLSNALTVEAGAPSEFVYIPEGRHKIYPKSHPKGIWVNLTPERGPVIAAAFNADLAKRQEQNVAPWLDFEHAGKGPSAGEPKSFRYEQGKGLICCAEWSTGGRTAIEGKDFRYFSGRFDLNGEEPCGLPERGPLGGLVNEPAFREIPAITASEADNPESTMNPIITILASCGFISSTESASQDVETLVRNRITAMQGDVKDKASKIAELEAELSNLKKEKDKATAECSAMKKQRAEDLVKAAVADGRIAPADEDTKSKYLTRIEAGDSFAEEILASLEPKHRDITKTIVRGGQSDSVTAGEHAFVTKAKKLVEASQAANIDAAFDMVASREPEIYSDYMKSLEG